MGSGVSAVITYVPLYLKDVMGFSAYWASQALALRARIVLAAAVLGRSFDWGLLPDTTGLDREGVIEALHAAVDAQLLAVDPDDGSFRFRHALSRDAVLAELLPPETAELSSRALSALEADQPGLPGEACERAADPHLARARAVLADVPLIDGHNDLAWQIRMNRAAPLNVDAYGVRAGGARDTDIERLRRGRRSQEIFYILRQSGNIVEIGERLQTDHGIKEFSPNSAGDSKHIGKIQASS